MLERNYILLSFPMDRNDSMDKYHHPRYSTDSRIFRERDIRKDTPIEQYQDKSQDQIRKIPFITKNDDKIPGIYRHIRKHIRIYLLSQTRHPLCHGSRDNYRSIGKNYTKYGMVHSSSSANHGGNRHRTEEKNAAEEKEATESVGINMSPLYVRDFFLSNEEEKRHDTNS